MGGLLRRVDWVNEVVGRVVSWLVVAIMLIVVYDVIARSVFGQPTQWVFELTKQLYAAHFMLLGGFALLHGAHIRVDLLREKMSRRLDAAVELAGFVVFFLPFISIMLWYGWRFAMRSWRAGETTWGVVQLPVYPVKTVIVVAAALLALQAILLVVRVVLSFARKD